MPSFCPWVTLPLSVAVPSEATLEEPSEETPHVFNNQYSRDKRMRRYPICVGMDVHEEMRVVAFALPQQSRRTSARGRIDVLDAVDESARYHCLARMDAEQAG